jgi:Fur family ferric uptake transcriptional regulator
MEVLETEEEYLSAEDIYRRVSQRAGEGIGLATVYRTLQLLEENGFLHKLQSGEGRSRYKLAMGEEERNRKVFICSSCRRSFPAGSLSEEERKVFSADEERMGREQGFRVQSRVMQFFGLCSACSGGQTDSGGAGEAGGRYTPGTTGSSGG